MDERVNQRVRDAARSRWMTAPRGYPRLDTTKLGRFSTRGARKALAHAQNAPNWQPTLARHAPRGVVYFPELATAGCAAVAISAGSAVMGSTVGYVVGALLAFVSYPLLQTGTHRPIVRAVLNATGYRWDPGAIQYVPWACRPPAGNRRQPAGVVGADCAIVVVAEQILDALEHVQQRAQQVGLMFGKPPLDTGRQMHEIAWAVADLVTHRASVAALGAADSDCAAALDEERRALLGRVAALDARCGEVTEALQIMASSVSELRAAAEPTVVPDLSEAYSNSVVHSEAARMLGGASW